MTKPVSQIPGLQRWSIRYPYSFTDSRQNKHMGAPFIYCGKMRALEVPMNDDPRKWLKKMEGWYRRGAEDALAALTNASEAGGDSK